MEEKISLLPGFSDELSSNLYDYSKMIKTPDEMGINDNGTWNTVMYDLDSIASYVEVLATGKRGKVFNAPAASKANGGQGGPLGGRYFINTGGRCTDKNGNLQERYSYMNNVPLSSNSTKLNQLRGIVPGIASNLLSLNPVPVLNAFVEPTYPKCRVARLKTVDINGTNGSASRYMTETEIKSIDPCAFENTKWTGGALKRGDSLAGWRDDKLCRSEGFTTMLKDVDEKQNGNLKLPGVNLFENLKHFKTQSTHANLPDDTLTNVYILLLSFFGIYIVKRLTDKK